MTCFWSYKFFFINFWRGFSWVSNSVDTSPIKSLHIKRDQYYSSGQCQFAERVGIEKQGKALLSKRTKKI